MRTVGHLFPFRLKEVPDHDDEWPSAIPVEVAGTKTRIGIWRLPVGHQEP
ncbi:MAG: putative transcriptional regulator [Planctomycetota bacterium]|jgi:predicted transcriptional regulator